MRTLLGLTLIVLTVVVVFSLDLSLGGGLSLKNVFIYVTAAMLLLQTMLGQPLKSEIRGLNACFGVLIAYALLSTFVAADIVQYRGYALVGNIIYLKSILFDWWVLFAIFFYAARSIDDVEKLIKLLLICFSLSNVATIGQLIGVLNLGRQIYGDKPDEDSRIFGVFGHANETGTLIAMLIPVYIAAADSASGIRRWLWIGGMVSSLTVLILTASRGALAGMLIGGVWAAILCRRYLSLQRSIQWLTTIVGLLVPMLVVVGIKYWDIMLGRFTEANHGGQIGSAQDISSGRTEIWAQGIARMWDQPWSFLTGFGWNSWSVMGFYYIPHNQYLSIWFELGLVGLISFILLISKSVSGALSAAAVADPTARRYMVACVFALCTLAIALIFAVLFIPWFFIWPYIGLSMRYASIVIARNERELASARRADIARPAVGSTKSIASSPVGAPRQPVVARLTPRHK